VIFEFFDLISWIVKKKRKRKKERKSLLFLAFMLICAMLDPDGKKQWFSFGLPLT